MAVVSKTTLKSYFNDGDLPVESNYVDFIDTMGDLSKTSDNRPGVTRLYRDDADSGYYVRHYWTGTHWYLQGYLSDAYHAGCRVEYANTVPWTGITGKPSTYTPSAHTHPGTDITSAVANATNAVNADTLDSLHATSFHRTDQNIVNSNDLKIGSGAVLGNTSQAVSAGYLDLYPTTGRIRWGNGDATYSAALYQLSTDKLCLSSYFTVAGGLRVGDATEPPDNDITLAGGINVGGTADPSPGQIWFGDANCRIYDDGANNLRLYNNYGYVDVGANSSDQMVFYTDESIFTFNKSVYSALAIVANAAGLIASAAGSTSNGCYIVKHATDCHIYSNYGGTSYIWMNYYGNSTYEREVRIGNGQSTYGNIRADNFYDESTSKSKRHIRPLSDDLNSLDIIKKIRPCVFEKQQTGNKRRIGMLAEELYEVLPEVVAVGEDGNPEAIAYGQIVPVLIQAIQELTEKVERLKQ